MSLTPNDRRGLTEAVAWSVGLGLVGLVVVVNVVQVHQVDATSAGILHGLLLALVARGMQRAGDRSSLAEGWSLGERLCWFTALGVVGAILIARVLVTQVVDVVILGELAGLVAALSTRTVEHRSQVTGAAAAAADKSNAGSSPSQGA